MPDQNNPTNVSSTPAQVNPPSEPNQIPTTPPAPMDIPVGDASMPPPFPPEVTPPEDAPPPPDSGSAAPSFDIPPVISPAPKSKGGGKRVIATILGLLVLVGGLGAGLILVQQQQDIRERAVTPCRVCSGSTCVRNNPPCSDDLNRCSLSTDCAPAPQPPAPQPPTTQAPAPQPQCTSDSQCKSPLVCRNGKCVTECTTNGDCSGDFVCMNNKCVPECTTDSECGGGMVCETNKCVPGPQPVPTSTTACKRTSSTRTATGTTITIEQQDMNTCKSACPDGQLWVAKYTCNDINLTQGCQDNGIILKQNAQVGNSFSIGSLTCGTVQIDVGCKNNLGTWGSAAYLSKSAAAPCGGATPAPPDGGVTAKCLNIRAFDTGWIELTSTALSKLKPGDKVRFTVSGQTSSGNFDKARFKINGVQRPEVTSKRPGTEEYFDEYTIPSAVTSFTINAQIHHASLGWSE